MVGGSVGLGANVLSPRPPQFFRDAKPVPVWQAVYIIRHGVRWTGMPAFPNFIEEDAWHIAEMVESKAGRLVANSDDSGSRQSKHLEGR